MEKFNWEEEQETAAKKAIEEHERLHKLFNENRFAFEIERKKMINKIIEGAGSEAQKKRLRDIQESWDNKMKKAGSKHNRLAMAKHLFWDHFDNIWNPLMQECTRDIKKLIRQKG